LIAGNFRNDQHTIKVGLNYRFNWGAPVAPLAPGY
jgi:outer membrane immunogenic protein